MFNYNLMNLDYLQLRTKTNFYNVYLAAMIIWTRKLSGIEGDDPEKLRNLTECNMYSKILSENIAGHHRIQLNPLNHTMRELVQESVT